MKYFNFLFLTILLVQIVGCDQEIDITDNEETIPILYAIIDPQDTVHMIRLGRSFKGDGNAYVSAMVGDSICYDTLTPVIDFYTSTGWKYHEMTFTPDQVNLTQEGIFTYNGLRVYKNISTITSLFIEGTYIVCSVISPNNHLVSATVDYYDPPNFIAPKQGIRTIRDFYPNPVEVKIEDPIEFNKYELHVLFHYTEVLASGDTLQKFVDKTLIKPSENYHLERSHAVLTFFVSGDLLFAQMMMSIKPNPEVEFRVPDQIELVLYTGSPEFFDYVDLNIMADDYGGKAITNVVNGQGVFALKYKTKVNNIFLGPITLDSLRYGRFTRDLKFVRW